MGFKPLKAPIFRMFFLYAPRVGGEIFGDENDDGVATSQVVLIRAEGTD